MQYFQNDNVYEILIRRFCFLIVSLHFLTITTGFCRWTIESESFSYLRLMVNWTFHMTCNWILFIEYIKIKINLDKSICTKIEKKYSYDWWYFRMSIEFIIILFIPFTKYSLRAEHKTKRICVFQSHLMIYTQYSDRCHFFDILIQEWSCIFVFNVNYRDAGHVVNS